MLTVLLLAAAAAATVPLEHYEKHEAQQLVPMLVEVIRFPTYAGQTEAHAAQKKWLMAKAAELGFLARDAGKITEIELPGPPGAPVLGLVIHGDVQEVEAGAWSFPPFAGRVENGFVLGRGAADDKGPLVQALLAMKALAASGIARTHTIRLLAGSEEESAAGEMAEYLKSRQPPDYSLVLDSEFPVVVGEKAWDGLGLVTPLAERGTNAQPYRVASFDAGLSPSIVPDRAELELEWTAGTPDWAPLTRELRAFAAPEDTRLEILSEGNRLRIIAHGRSAHSGVNIAGGRNALVALARALAGKLPAGGADDLLAFARIAGQDLYASGLGMFEDDPVWGHYFSNVATLKPVAGDPSMAMLYVNIRRNPSRTGARSRAHLEGFVAAFNRLTGARLTIDAESSYFLDEPLAFDLAAPMVTLLMDVYARATGMRARPAISGGGTYAKRLPNAIAFGMWFPGKPYPGHGVDEKIAVEDLQRGARVLVQALTEIATGPRIEKPLGK